MDYFYHRDQELSTFLDKKFEVLCFVLKLKGREDEKLKNFNWSLQIKKIQLNDTHCPKDIQDVGLHLFD